MKVPWLVEVNKLISSQSFGELALMNNEPRAAQVKCITNSTFAVLSKQTFLNVLDRMEA